MVADNDTQPAAGSALARGIGILRCFSGRQQQLSRKELVARTGLPKATISRLTQTLCELGLLRPAAPPGSFVLGPDVLTFAPAVLGRLSLRHVARAAMQELADHARAQVTISAGTGAGLVFVEICQGEGSKVFRPEIGTRLSLTRTASGRAYLLAEQPHIRERLLRRLTEEDSAQAAWLTKRLSDTSQDLTQRGFAHNVGDMHPDIMGAAIPVRAPAGQILVFTCTVTAFQATQEQLLADIGPRLMAVVKGVEAALPEQAATIDWSNSTPRKTSRVRWDVPTAARP
jgi:DNA-binding IclR family transcriptional regulator